MYIDSHLNEVMNITAALEFQKKNPPEKQKTYTLTLYGKEYSFRFPSLTEEQAEKAEDITFELYDKILTLSNLGYLNDYVTGLWKEISANYHVLETKDGCRGLKKREVLVSKSAYPALEDQATILMAKDMVMGRYNNEKLKYFTSKDEYEEVPISRDYEMPDPRNREKTLKFFDNYTV